jgi:drug/metabolite transporter (DMT)-like permease
VCTVYCFDLQLKALQKISAFTCNLMYNLEPLYGICLAFIFFDEGAVFLQKIKVNVFIIRPFYVGLVLVVLAIVLQMLRLIKSKEILISKKNI